MAWHAWTLMSVIERTTVTPMQYVPICWEATNVPAALAFWVRVQNVLTLTNVPPVTFAQVMLRVSTQQVHSSVTVVKATTLVETSVWMWMNVP